ncbi:MAG: hypothetical protein WC714_19310 [Candidatus Obscuribacterales bacterium]|jgi:hypothetical protein
MKTSNKKVVSVVLQEGKLQSNVFASSKNIVKVEKIDDCLPTQGVKLTIDLEQMLPGDFVVRTVLAGNRRFIELLAHEGNSPLEALQGILELTGEERHYIDASRIEFSDGQSLVSISQCELVAAPKGR